MDFLRNNARFSFKLAGVDAWDTAYTSEVSCEGDTLTTVYRFDGGVTVTNIAKKYDAVGAYEWVNYIENTTDAPSEIISELWDCDCTLPLKHEDSRGYDTYIPDIKNSTKIYAPNGSVFGNKEFYCNINEQVENVRLYHIYPGDTKQYTTSEGRSSNSENAPFFNVHKQGEGYIFAIGWTGQWSCQISRANDSISFRSKIEDTFFRVLPGERFRTSSVVIMPYRGDVASAQNKWRRLVKEHFSLIGSAGREQQGPLCTGIWGGMRTQSALERISAVHAAALPFEYIWMDAGWYGIDTNPSADEFEGDWAVHVGDWRVSPKIHPDGLEAVSRAAHDAGLKFLLWLEPERALRTTPTALAHPEYFLANNNPHESNRLLNLGNPDAWEYCFQTLADLIERLPVDCYRQDFNFGPLDYWRRNDDPDRRGITEIKHINGLYRLWDELLRKFPRLLIDNCASGGRRIDIETLRRSIPLWRSDFQCPADYTADISQLHNQCFSAWMPYSGTGTGRLYDEYRVRSAYAAAMTASFFFSEKDPFCDTEQNVEFIRKYTTEYLKARPYFSEDFYALTEPSDKLDIWCAMQFDRPAQRDGIVEVFRREDAPYEVACFALRGIDRQADYLFTDADGGEFTISGEQLATKGLTITILEKRKAKLYFYRAVR